MKGDLEAFEKNWSNRPEADYIHWTKGDVKNQIQFAFRQHFLTFEKIFESKSGYPNSFKRKFIELGAGRGSLSAYYAEKGDFVTVTDLSPLAINLAKKIFKKNKLSAQFKVVNSENIEFNSLTFDICASIGLLEHFENPTKVIAEQFRILNKGGLCFAYIVPKKNVSINNDYKWLNKIIQSYSSLNSTNKKDEVYRTSYDIEYYTEIFESLGFEVILSSGIYPVPMISNSSDFPFTLMNKKAEEAIVEHFASMLNKRKKETSLPWLCDEHVGNAILIVGRKL